MRYEPAYTSIIGNSSPKTMQTYGRFKPFATYAPASSIENWARFILRGIFNGIAYGLLSQVECQWAVMILVFSLNLCTRESGKQRQTFTRSISLFRTKRESWSGLSPEISKFSGICRPQEHRHRNGATGGHRIERCQDQPQPDKTSSRIPFKRRREKREGSWR